AGARAHAAPDAGARTDPDVPSNRKLILPLSLSESVEFRPNAVELRSKPQGLALDPSTNTNSGLSPAGVPENGTPQQEQDKGLEASPAFSEEASTRSFEAKGRRQHHHVRFLADDSRDASDSPHGQLVVESSVSGGKIRLNGRSRPDWLTPHMFSLAPGTYRVEVTKGGYPAWRGFARVAEGTKSWTVAKFAPPKGVFVVETDPPGMQVFIDGQSYGRSEVQTTLPAGEHTYQVVPPSGLQPYLGTFRLEGGHILVRKVTWRRRENPGKQAARSVSRAG
ncbi:MAG: PEGA domain-containing protein, partial [Acidobacteriia bacterium]|nr:PEGA domain-containing protein [Terriglobia bacterium]